PLHDALPIFTPDELAWQVERAHCKVVICKDDASSRVGNAVEVSDLILSSFESQLSLTRQPEFDLQSVQAIVFTSGTTGKPKGAQITFGNHFYSAVASSWRIGILPTDRWLLNLPLYHVGGLSIVFRSALYGTAIVLQDGFDVERVWRAMETQGVTLMSLVPTMLHRLLESRPGQPFPPSVRMVLLGGAAASPELLERALALNIPVATTYGLTEAASQVATMLPEDVRKKPGSVGKPLMFSSVRIVDEQGNNIGGEIVVSGPTVMKGYYGDSTTLVDGELHTGDIGYLDEEGDLFLVQRRSDLIVSGGENVYPVEVENVLRQHPAVADACVVGISSEEWGQQVAAAVVLKPEMHATSEDLDAFCRQHLAGYKCPRKYAFVPELPQTASGKISRRAVAELLE